MLTTMMLKSLPGTKLHHLQARWSGRSALLSKAWGTGSKPAPESPALAEVAGELHLLARVVGERQRERQLRVQVLRNAHAVQNRRRLVVTGPICLSPWPEALAPYAERAPSLAARPMSTIAPAEATAAARQLFRIVLLDCMIFAPSSLLLLSFKKLHFVSCNAFPTEDRKTHRLASYFCSACSAFTAFRLRLFLLITGACKSSWSAAVTDGLLSPVISGCVCTGGATGNPVAQSISMARSIGILTVPFDWSTQV
jgi:hypothetical protein